MCGVRTPIFLHMHDAAAAEQVLAAVEMEIMDLASQLLLGALPAPCMHATTTGLSPRNKPTDQCLSAAYLHACAAPHLFNRGTHASCSTWSGPFILSWPPLC